MKLFDRMTGNLKNLVSSNNYTYDVPQDRLHCSAAPRALVVASAVTHREV
jgi:hypothetical protein